MVGRTKPAKLRVFAESELRDCEDYFLEIQSDPTVPPNEIITASERLALIHSEIDLRHSDAKHRQTQRLARWAIAFGMVSMAAAITSGVTQFFARKPTHETLLETGEPIVATPSARELLTPTQELADTSPAAMPELTAAPSIVMPDFTAVPSIIMPELTAAPTTVMPELTAAPSTVTPELEFMVEQYVASGETVGSELKFFAERVNYFGAPNVARQQIERDLVRYNKKWPHRRFWIDGDLQVERQSGNEIKLVIPLRYELRNGSRHTSGKVLKSLTLVKTADNEMQIVAVNESKAP